MTVRTLAELHDELRFLLGREEPLAPNTRLRVEINGETYESASVMYDGRIIVETEGEGMTDTLELRVKLDIMPDDTMPDDSLSMDATGVDHSEMIAEINERLERGDVWAWCTVAVTVEYGPWSATDYLGGCSYQDDDDFISGGYYSDMIRVAADAVEREMVDTARPDVVERFRREVADAVADAVRMERERTA